jgi:hypothetical protein
MSASMERRFERLLFFAGPLALASLLVMFVALASEQQDERKRAKCLRSAADAITLYEGYLEQARQGQYVVIAGERTNNYWSALRYTLIPWEVRNIECVQHFPEFGSKDKIAAPKALTENARKEAAALDAKPLSLYGIELPEKATLSLFGTPAKMDLTTLVRVMQVALGPILLLWLSSMYQTRHRESLAIGRMKDVSTLYPHLINVYPVLFRGDSTWEPARKKSWSKFVFLRFGLPAIYALVRIALLSAFIGPPVGFYVASVYLLRNDAYSSVFVVMGVIVGFFALTTAVCELFPWHVQKKFRIDPRSTT